MTRVDGPLLTVRTGLTAADGTDLPPLEVSLPTAHADLLDPTATPALPVLASLAAARGEDLFVEGAVDARMAAAGPQIARVQSGWWQTGPVAIEVESTYESQPHGTGVGLFFSRGIDSWSTLLDLLDDVPGERVTHLLAVHHGDGAHRPIEAEIVHGHQQVADELGLTLVVLSTSARTLLDPFQPWLSVSASALLSAGLVASGTFSRLVLSSSTSADAHHQLSDDAQVMGAIATGSTDVVRGNPDRTRPERVAHVLGSGLARSTLQICWEGMTPGNCGRCVKCQLAMSTLLLLGDADPTAGFDGVPDPTLVAGLTPPGYEEPTVRRLVADLPPEHEDLRRAWADAWAAARGEQPRARWGDGDPPGLAGPGVAARVAAGLRAATGQADAPTPAPLGWTPGSVPLRPALDDHDAIRALVASAPARPGAWAVVEPHVRQGNRDPHQGGLALRAHAAFGPGACYLPGLLWALDQPPVLDRVAVAALLRTARSRLWWRSNGDLDPLRVVETIEHGCLPLQVMPAGPALDLAARLPSPLASLVVDEDALVDVDLSAPAVAARLGPAVEHVLAGSAESDLMAAYRA